MDSILDELKDALKSFESSIKKDLAEVQKQKEAVQAIQEEIHHTVKTGQYIRDNNRIILSAPEIVMGNVDHNGDLLGAGNSVVVVRGNQISLEGAGSGGAIVQRAPRIHSIAVDPGYNGISSILGSTSEIVSQARSVTLQSNDDKECFSTPTASYSVGVNLVSDSVVNLHAKPANKTLKEKVEQQLTDLGKVISNLDSKAKTIKSMIDDEIKAIEKLVSDQEQFNEDEVDICNDYPELDAMNQSFHAAEMSLCQHISQYVKTLAMSAEMNRREKALKDKKSELSSASSSFDTKTTGGTVSIETETLTMRSTDGDGNIRENPEAGVFVHAPHFSMLALDKNNNLAKDSSVTLNAEKMSLSTVNPKLDSNMEKGDYLAEGNLEITTKTMSVSAVDKKTDGSKLEEKALTQGGQLDIRFETVNVSNTDTEGKSTGKISLNAKKINVAAMDVDKEKRTDTEMAKDSQLVLLADKTFVGSNKEKKAATLVQIASKSVGVMGADTAEMQQGEGKAVVTLAGGNATAGGSKVELQGNTTIAGTADIKGEAKAPKGTFDEVSAKSAFKSPNITDKMGAGMPGQAGKPSAKLKEEEAKTE